MIHVIALDSLKSQWQLGKGHPTCDIMKYIEIPFGSGKSKFFLAFYTV